MRKKPNDVHTRNHPVQGREQSEPFERTNPVPVALYLLVVGLVTWSVYYIATSELENAPELGDRRTLTSLSTPVTVTSISAINGAEIFAAHCAACHQTTGLGIPGAFPPLAGSEWVKGSPKVLAKIVLHGVQGNLVVAGKTFAGAMPGFKDTLVDAQIAAVLTHIRGQWGNGAGVIDTTLVSDARKSTADRATPWNGDADLSAHTKD